MTTRRQPEKKEAKDRIRKPGVNPRTRQRAFTKKSSSCVRARIMEMWVYFMRAAPRRTDLLQRTLLNSEKCPILMRTEIGLKVGLHSNCVCKGQELYSAPTESPLSGPRNPGRHLEMHGETVKIGHNGSFSLGMRFLSNTKEHQQRDIQVVHKRQQQRRRTEHEQQRQRTAKAEASNSSTLSTSSNSSTLSVSSNGKSNNSGTLSMSSNREIKRAATPKLSKQQPQIGRAASAN
ncbi:hypothetical protein BDZ97DRAFT_1759431 [Flammula alnicola]|nr:hypothetical protein BDZ97DRAFT_1759431 [Flammula alnicola]